MTLKKGQTSSRWIYITLGFFLLQIHILAQDWPKGELNASGLDLHRLEEGLKAIENEEFGKLNSLVVIKKGKLVFERYFNDWPDDSLHQMQSATKSIVSTFLGIAIQEGMIKGVDEKVLPYFEEKDIQNIDQWKRDLTIKDLITQRHGLKWKEAPWNAPDNTWRKVLESTGDWYESVLSNPMAVAPGTVYNYSNAAPLLTTGIVQQASGMNIDDFAKKYLFEPLGIKRYRFWAGNGGPQNNGSALLFLTARDMAKIGQLYLQNGIWNGKQILPTGWTNEAARTSHLRNIKDNRFYRFGYGYFWWNAPKAVGNNSKADPNVYLARGAGGQYLIVSPDEDMVVVINAWDLRRANQLYQIYTQYLQSEDYASEILQPELMSSVFQSPKVDMAFTISPDGQEAFFVRKDSFYTMNSVNTIFMTSKSNGQWSAPEVALFSGNHSDGDPFISPDGQRLFFTSNRVSNGGGTKEDRDIWYADKVGDSWSTPQRLPGVNSDKSEYGPTVDNQGNLYFGSYRDGGEGSGDVWVSYFQNNSYQKPVNLGKAINTNGGEWGSSISPDGKVLIFEASGRSRNVTPDGDLYISHLRNGEWQPAIHLEELSSGGSDLTPRIHKGTLYFASNRHKDFVVEMFGNNNVDLYQIPMHDILNYLKRKE